MHDPTDEKHEVIRIDPEIADLVPDYLVRRRADLATLHDALAKGDLETPSQLGHKMKGSGAAYGFRRISEIGACLERAAQQGDSATLHSEVQALSAHLDQIRLVHE